MNQEISSEHDSAGRTMHHLLCKIAEELEQVKSTPAGRPIRYYNAYIEYTLAYNSGILKNLLKTADPKYHMLINLLLIDYELYGATLKILKQFNHGTNN